MIGVHKGFDDGCVFTFVVHCFGKALHEKFAERLIGKSFHIRIGIFEGRCLMAHNNDSLIPCFLQYRFQRFSRYGDNTDDINLLCNQVFNIGHLLGCIRRRGGVEIDRAAVFFCIPLESLVQPIKPGYVNLNYNTHGEAGLCAFSFRFLDNLFGGFLGDRLIGLSAGTERKNQHQGKANCNYSFHNDISFITI